MALLKRKAVITAKIETVYGTDAAPTEAANAILVSDLTVDPMDMKTVSRDLLRQYFGNSEQLPTEIFSKASFSCEIAGSGTAGTAPAWGVLLRACGMSETITAGTKVEYKPASASLEAVSIYANVDGVLHKLTGARGTMKLGFAVNGRPQFNFDFVGIFNAVTDVTANPVTLTAWKTPLPVNRTNTPTFTLHGYAAKLQSLDIDLANSLQPRSLINGADEVPIVDRKPSGNISMEAVRVADKDWWTAIKTVTLGALQLVHGTTAGNKVQIDGPKTQIVNPKYAESNGIVMLNAGLVFVPNTGNDELVIAAL